MTIKNLRILAKSLKPEQINRLEAGANLHKRHANIEFKILKYGDHKISVEVKQGKHLAKNYADMKTLIERTKQLFQVALPAHTEIIVNAVPYTEHPISNINADWLDTQMTNNQVNIKDIVEDTGLDKSNISAWRNDKRPMSQIVKTMFYFYFLNKNNTADKRASTEIIQKNKIALRKAS